MKSIELPGNSRGFFYLHNEMRIKSCNKHKTPEIIALENKAERWIGKPIFNVGYWDIPYLDYKHVEYFHILIGLSKDELKDCYCDSDNEMEIDEYFEKIEVN